MNNAKKLVWYYCSGCAQPNGGQRNAHTKHRFDDSNITYLIKTLKCTHVILLQDYDAKKMVRSF